MNRFSNYLSLELVARAISKDYGVEVRAVEAATASTAKINGRMVICIPNIEIDNPQYLTLLRGYIDHEAGHCRFTDFDVWNERTPQLERMLCNIYEDCFVERRMGKSFIGCGRNLQDLASLLFTRGEGVDNPDTPNYADATQPNYVDLDTEDGLASLLIDYCIVKARSVDNPRLRNSAEYLHNLVDERLPQLSGALDPLLLEGGTSEATRTSLEIAERTAKVLRQYIKDNVQNAGGNGVMHETAEKLEAGLDKAFSKLADHDGDVMADRMTTRIGEIVDSNKDAPMPDRTYAFGGGSDTTEVSRTSLLAPLSEQLRTRALQEVARLDAQLQGLLQTVILNRGGFASRGRVDYNRLHRLSVSNPRVFSSRIEKVKLNTEVVLCVDMSGSMSRDQCVNLTSMALYALMTSLRKLPGVRSSAIGFAGNTMLNIIMPNMPMHKNMLICPSGGTLCGEALVTAAKHFSADPDARRIVFMLTDGASANERFFARMVERYKKNGIELYGFCIMNDSLEAFLPKNRYRRVDKLNELSASMFTMMRQALLGGVANGKNAAA